MNPRWSATVKGYALLAVAAATPGWDVATLIMFFLVVHQERVWDPAERRVKRAAGTPKASLRARLGTRKLEIGLAFAITVARTAASWFVGYFWADVAMVAVIGTVIAPGGGGWARTRFLAACRKRRWEHSLVAVLPAAIPTIVDLGSSRGGEWVDVRVAPGATVADLVNRADAIAAFHGVAEVRVRPDTANAGAARILALRSDPLAGPGIAWPPPPSAVSLWNPVPVGVDETGRWVNLTLFEHNLLVGGEPGAGKSVAVHQLVAAAALDPAAVLWLCDPKLVELACWRAVATRFAGNDIAEAIDLLRQAQSAMDDRYRRLLDQGLRKVPSGTPLHLVVVDELAHYVTWPDKKPRDAFTDTLRDLVSRGRAAGIVVIAATQKPASEVIPTSLRDLFGYRWALRCTTPAASDTILGSGWASQGVSAATVSPAQRGVGWLLHEAGLPVRLRAFHLDDHTIATVAAHAQNLRATHQGDRRA